MNKSIISSMWNESDMNQRFKILKGYYKSKATIGKHIDKMYSQLPYSLKSWMNRKLKEELNGVNWYD